MTGISSDALAWLALSFTIALLGGTIASFGGMLFVRISRARAHRREAAATEAARPILSNAFVQFLAGSHNDEAIRQYVATQRQDVADSLLLFQSTVGGSARDRLCDLALDLSLVQEWCTDADSADVVQRRKAMSRLAYVCTYEPCRRLAGEMMVRALNDRDEEVRLSAARGLVKSGQKEDIERVFRLALGPNPLTRVVLSEELRPHAMILCAEAVPEALASAEVKRIHAALEILVTWERALPLEKLQPFLDHWDREVRILAFRLATLSNPDGESRGSMVHALSDEDQEIRALAVIAVGRFRLAQGLPQLALCMRRGPIEIARQAAEALANMGSSGWQTLQELSTGPNATAAQAAMEIIERGRPRI